MASTNASTSCERKYQCKLCPKRFTSSSVLTKHVRVHTGEKPFQCKTCLRSFSQLTNMKRHQKIHNKDKTFKCKYCDERFSQLAPLLKHESTHTMQEIKDYSQDNPLTYPVISLRNQTAVSSSLDANSNQAENIRTSVQSSSKNLTSFSNFLQIPSSNLKENDIFASNQTLALSTDDFQQQIQMGFANNRQNTDGKTRETFFHDSNNPIVVSEESQESLSFDQQISQNCAEGSDVQASRVKLELSTNMSADTGKYFYNPLERKNSTFDLALRRPSDEVKVIDIKPDLSVLSSTSNRSSINTVDHLNATLQLSSSSQDNFADSSKKNYNDIFENEQVPTESIQYFKSESELCFDNNDLPQGVQTATNDFIQDSSSGLKSFNDSQLNLSLPATSSSFHFENSRVYIDSLNSQNQDARRNGSNVDFDRLNISHSLSNEKFEVDEDETLVIRKQIKADLSHLDCKDDDDDDDDIKFEFPSVPLATSKAPKKLEDEQMKQKENSFDQMKKRVLYLDTKDRMAQNEHIESNDKLCRDLESGDIILLSPPSSIQSTSQPNNPLSHSIQNTDKPTISCNYEDGSNEDVVITCESNLEKSLEEVIRHESHFDTSGTIAIREVSENPSIVIESVFSMNNKDKHGSNAREELCENSMLSSMVVKHSGISDEKKARSEMEVINLVDFSPKEMRNDEQHNWSIPLVDIEEIAPQKLDAESHFKIQVTETEDGSSKELNLASSKIWDIGYLKTDSQEPLLEEMPNFQQNSNDDAKNIPNLSKHVVSLEPSSCITCSWCNEKFSNKSSFLSHLCARSETFHSSKSPRSEDVDQIPFKPGGQSPKGACETAINCPNLIGSHQKQTEKFSCKYCTKHFSQASILVKHIETHTGKKAFVCDLCQQPFSQLTNLNPVKKFHFRNKMLHCQFCQKTFPHSFQLLNHLKYHARSIQRSIKALEDKIKQKQREKVILKKAKKINIKSLKLRKSTSQKYLKMKPKSMQLSKKNVNQPNSSNCLIPVVQLKRSHSDHEFNVISQQNDENRNAQDLCNKKMKKRLLSQQCFNSVKVSENLTKNTSSLNKKSNAEECTNISRTYGQEGEEEGEDVEAMEDVNQIEFSFSGNTSEDQGKVNTDSELDIEQFRSENNSLHILENSKSEEANKTLQNVLVPIQPSELVSNIEYIESLPQKDMLPIPSSSLLQKSYARDHTSNLDSKLLETDLGSMQSGFGSADVTTRAAVNFHNTSRDENLSEIVFVTSNCADQSSLSNAPVKSGQFHCKICNKSFNRKCILIKHLRTHTGEKPYKCDFCPRLFSQLHNLNRHKKTHLPFGLFPCKFCPFRFSRISELNAHTKKMHMSMKRHSCTFCNMRFSSSSVLKRHIRTHTGEKPFVCELCNRAFSQATNLTRHMKVHVPGRAFRCRYCSNTFKQYWHFKRHLKTHIHLGKMSNEDAFTRKTRRQHCIQQIHSRRTKPPRSNDFICKLSDSKEYKIARRIQSFEEKIENLGSKQASLQVTSSYEPATFPDILKTNSFQDCSDNQSYDETIPIITGTPEILAINGQLLPTSNYNLNRVKSESNNNHDVFINSDCKFLREADDATDENQSKEISRSDTELTPNYENDQVGILWRATHGNQSKANARNKNLFIDNYETIEEPLENENATTLVNTVNVKLEPEDVDIEKQSESTSKNSNSDRLCQNESTVSFKKYPCKYCNKLFHHSQVLYRHLRSQHKSEMMMTSTCQLCNASFPNSDTLNKHHKTCSQLLLPYFCNLCKEKFPNSSELNWHRQRKHSGGVNHYFCRYCTKVFSKNNALTEHIRTHTGEKPFVCDVCQRPFSQATNLKRHQKIHARNGSFVCKYCKASFSWLSHLSRHLHMHAGE